MKLAFTDISQKPSSYTLSGGGWFPVDEIACVSPPQAEIRIRRNTDKTVALLGTLSFTAILACDRCGMPVERPLQEEFEYLFTIEEEDRAELAEVECSDEDCITVHLREPYIDLNEILREQVFLAIPVKTLCSDDCRGLCPFCGALLKNERCNCAGESATSPFAVLRKLRKTEEK
jgi:uncharacterized protein